MSLRLHPAATAPDLLMELQPLYAFVASRVGPDRSLAEDLTQETLMAALEGGFDPSRGPLRAWLFGIAIRKIVDHGRRKRTWVAAARELAVRMIREPLPDAMLLQDETLAVVNEALAKLPLPAAALLIRKYFEGATVAEMAVELGATEKAVESQLSRAREALHEIIERLRETDP